MTSRRTKISPKTGRGPGHVTHTILAVRSAILATAWLPVSIWRHWLYMPIYLWNWRSGRYVY